MIEYWLQNGEAYALRNAINTEKVNEKEIKDAIERIFQPDGKLTIFSNAIFSSIIPNVKNKYRSQIKEDQRIGLKWIAKYIHEQLKSYKGRGICSMCGGLRADVIKGWMFPFIIAFDKFPNLYPSGKVKSMLFCKRCATLSILAYNRLFFNAQGQDHVSILFFFSTSADLLNKIVGAYMTIEPKAATDAFKNIVLDSITYFPYEFLAYMLYKVALSVEKLDIGYNIDGEYPELNATVAGFVPKKKKLYFEVSIINRIEIVLSSILKFIKSSGVNAFKQMYVLMRMSENESVKVNQFIERERFFKYLLKYKKINWSAALNIVMYRLKSNQRVNFISTFIRSFLETVSMNERELFDIVAGLGYRLGRAIIEKENEIKKAKKYIYELRRARRLSEFLDRLNHIQIDLETVIDDRPFRENPERFEDLKSMFLIDMCNGIFVKTKSKSEGGKNES